MVGRRWALSAFGLVAGLTTSNALAWKPITHAYLAQQAVKDLLDDEFITLDEIDPTIDPKDVTKTPIKGLLQNSKNGGKFRSSKAVRDLVKKCPAEYYTGLMGPDALPDLLTGQGIIHPPGGPKPSDGTEINVNGPGTGYWWNHMWAETAKGAAFDKGCNRAFVLGMFAHGAGDLFAHTFVNAHTGNIFQLDINGLRHVLLEGYFFDRTPPLEKHEGTSVYDLAAEGMTADLAKLNRFVLDPFPLGDKAGHGKSTSLLWQFGKLQQWVKNNRADMDQLQKKWHSDYQAAEAKFHKLWKKCSKYKPSTWDECAEAGVVKVTDVAVAYAKHKLGGGIIRQVVLPYMDDWIQDIDEGLIEWVRVNHRIGIRLMFTDPSKVKADSAIDYTVSQLKDYFLAHVIRMIGLPDWLSDAAVYVQDMVKQVSKIIDQVTAPFKVVKDAIAKDMKAFAKWIIKSSFGLDIDAFKEYWFNPSKYIDVAFKKFKSPLSGLEGDEQLDANGNAVTVANLNKWMRLKATDHTGKENFDWRKFPAAFNTVQMIKLTFLDQPSVGGVLQTLESDQKWPTSGDHNVMLGQWQGAMDSGNQWANGSRLVFARECRVFNRLFMKHIGPKVKSIYQPINECATSDSWVKGGVPKSADPFRILGATKFEMEAGGKHRFDLDGDFKSFAVWISGEGASKGSVTAKDAKGFTFKAPDEVSGSSDDVTLTATDDDMEQAVAKVRVTKKLRIAPSVGLVKSGTSVKFFIEGTKRKLTWKVAKGRGQFGDDKKLAALKADLSSLEAKLATAPRAARAQLEADSWLKLGKLRKQLAQLEGRRMILADIAETQRKIATEEATYYAPKEVKDDEPEVEVVAEYGATKEGPAGSTSEKFELVPNIPQAELELKKAFDTNLELQVALKHADAIDRARVPGKLLAWDPGIVAHLKYNFQATTIVSGHKYKLMVPGKGIGPAGLPGSTGIGNPGPRVGPRTP